MRVLILVLLGLAAVPRGRAGNARRARLHAHENEHVYDCVIRLARGGAPLAGVELSIGADMPSMPMAHNLKPVKAKPGKKPGDYEARLDLEMAGEWALKLRLSGPVRDQLVLHYDFDDKGARPAVRRSGTPPRK
jgi:hypothetical protein